jgi:tetratricopeptide (TPR) repeat protein
MRCLAAATLALATIVQAAGPARAQTAQAPWLARLSSWLEAVNEHRPGALDTPARLVAFWPAGDMDEVRTDFLALAAICKREMDRSARPARVVYRNALIAVPELRRILGLTDEETAQDHANRILKRAAILYADVLMRVVPLVPGAIGCSTGSSLVVNDGNSIGMGCIHVHWLQGRALLDAVQPNPAADRTVRAWYLAGATYLFEHGDYANARPLLDHARLIFRSDPEILFQRGYYHEGFASPAIQIAAVAAGTDPRAGRLHLEEAEDLFRKAVKEDPEFTESRVHHGNVLALLGRHEEAAETLRVAAAAAAGPELRYYAELFLGHAELSLGNRAAARDHYLRAAARYRQAQSPPLALALLARQSGDRSGVREAMAQVLALDPARTDESDPWWWYYRWQDKGRDARLAELYAPFLPGATR